jgi:hypothetical protein
VPQRRRSDPEVIAPDQPPATTKSAREPCVGQRRFFIRRKQDVKLTDVAQDWVVLVFEALSELSEGSGWQEQLDIGVSAQEAMRRTSEPPRPLALKVDQKARVDR